MVDDDEKRTALITLRVRPSEKAAIKQAAKAERMSMADYLMAGVIRKLVRKGYLP